MQIKLLNLKNRALAFKDYYPKVEYPRSDFLKDTSIMRNLIFVVQQVTIMQIFLNNGSDDICNFGKLVVFSETVEKV